MAVVVLDTSKITNWTSFHSLCKEVFGFPDFYGTNMDAWIDCLTYIDQGDGMSKFHLRVNEKLNIRITETDSFRKRLPEIYDALKESAEFVNRRRIEAGEEPLIVLEFL